MSSVTSPKPRGTKFQVSVFEDQGGSLVPLPLITEITGPTLDWIRRDIKRIAKKNGYKCIGVTAAKSTPPKLLVYVKRPVEGNQVRRPVSRQLKRGK